MNHSILKALLYVRPEDAYWRRAQPPPFVHGRCSIDAYPIQMAPRLTDGHFTTFDAAGLPTRSYGGNSSVPIAMPGSLCSEPPKRACSTC